MKFTVDRAVLLKALAHVQSVVERRNTIPILANVLLEAAEGRLTLTATDMEIAVVEEITTGVEVTQPGRCTAPAATLYEIARKLGDGLKVEFDQAGGDAPLGLRAGRYVLENLGLSDYEADALERTFFSFDRTTLRELSDLWKPGVPLDRNHAYMERSKELDSELEAALVDQAQKRGVKTET